MNLAAPIIQYGFAGFCAVLLGIVFWLIKALLKVLEKNSEVISKNSDAIATMTKVVNDNMELTRDVHDKLISRPCIAKKEQ